MAHSRWTNGLTLLSLAATIGASRTALAADLDGWLLAHPGVAARMIWQFPDQSEGPVGIQPRPIELPGPLPIGRGGAGLGDVGSGGRRRLEAPAPVVGSTATRAALSSASLRFEQGPIVVSPEVPPIDPGAFCAAAPRNEDGARVLAWACWPKQAQQELRDRVASYRSWVATACPLYQEYAKSEFEVKPDGFDALFSSVVDLDPLPVADPPANLQPHDPADPNVPWQVVPAGQAFAIYVRQVAIPIALELEGCLAWSFGDLDADALTTLLDGRELFEYVEPGPSAWGAMTATGYAAMTTVLPAPPLVVLGFLAENGMLAGDRLETIVRLLDWERHHLKHTVGGDTATPLPAGVEFWDYNGTPPGSRMIRGVLMAEPMIQPGGYPYYVNIPQHWTGGCGGSAGFTEQVLRVVGIAARATSYQHFQNAYAIGGGVRAWTAHADDPYGILAAPEIPTDEILVDDATFQKWFIDEPDPAQRKKAVGRRNADLHLKYLPVSVLKRHCRDLFEGDDHANGIVYKYGFASAYGVAELEAMGLWTGIEAKLATLGGCPVVGMW